MVTVRPEEEPDLQGIREVHAACFATPSEARLVDALRAAGRLSASFVAVEEDRIIGHLGFSPLTLGGVPRGWGLGPLAVLSACRRRGVAALLIGEGLSCARRGGAGFVVVLGDPTYYGRFGFLPAWRWKVSGAYAGGDAFQALELTPGAIPTEGGAVRYASEFGALGV
jgi:putative acetyltransferase